MIIIHPYIFKQFNEIGFGFSTKTGNDDQSPFYFNMSFNVGDSPDSVSKNRDKFFSHLNINEESVVFQKQVHGDFVVVADKPGNIGECDGLIAANKNLALAISTADCCAIFIYDPKEKIIAAVHSGWRGTSKKILLKTLKILQHKFHCSPGNLFCYISPSIEQQNYEVGEDVASKFDGKYLHIINDKKYLDIKAANYDMLTMSGVKPDQIQVSRLCSFSYSALLHSYRRDGIKSGRAMGIIFMKESI